MKWLVGLGLACVVVGASCERQVKPAATPSLPPTKPPVSTASKDQTPELNEHPRALYNQPPAATAAVVPVEYKDTVRTYFDTVKTAGEQPPDGFSATINRYCPITPKHALGKFTANEHTVQFGGRTVGFCCDDCPEAWKAMSDDERWAALKVVFEKK